ncbi:MAG TPA: cation:proton antiporter [Phycisphaerae bacterium]|nr:cation:proton antiporter [Phycisphaerae bacterium]
MSLITTVAAGFTAAWLLGLLTQRLGLSPIVGYILGGYIIGPHSPGFVGNLEVASQLAEVGVILLMFGVGLHFHLKDLWAVKGIALPGAIGQSLVATVLAIIVFTAFGMPLKTSAVLGMAMAVASTVVLMRVLMDADALNSTPGHVAVGWLIVEDIFTVLLLVLIPVLGATGGSDAAAAVSAAAPAGAAAAAPFWTALGIALLKLGTLVVIVMYGGSRVVPWVLVQVTRLRSRELFTLTVLVFSIAIAAGSYFFFGASMALGAFLAGMVVAQSPVSHQAAADALPMRDAFAVLFFVAVGMLFDPAFLLVEPLMTLAALGIILIAKPLSALVIVALLGHSTRTALTVALGLAQIGEFSFILSELAGQHGLMPPEGHSLLVACAIISITLNPGLFRLLPSIENWLRRHPRLWSLLNGRAERRAAATNLAATEEISRHAAEGQRLAVVVGFGPVGRSVHRILQEAHVKTVVVDMNLDTVSSLNGQGQTAIFGDASHESILEGAGVRKASHLILTLPHSADRAAVVAAARNLNPKARIFVRARYLREREDLERVGATAAVFEEAEAAVGLARLVLADAGVRREAVELKVRDLRLQLIMENITNIRALRAQTVMVPWTRVRRLLESYSRTEVLAQLAQERYSRWPVVQPHTGRVTGYLLVKDLISQPASDDWTRLVRPLGSIRPDDDVESALARMQAEAATVYLVGDADRPVGLITLEDIIEQVVGRIEDEYPHEAHVSLHEAIRNGGIVLNLISATREQAIRELAAVIPPDRLPPNLSSDDVVSMALTREDEFSTDLGVGVAIPHARCPNLKVPFAVLGRSSDGIIFSPHAAELVTLVFLLVTPTDQPEIQLALLAQLARLAGDAPARERLRRATSATEILDILSERPASA